MNWDYIAGFLDGEGSVGSFKRPSRGNHRYINFSNTHRATLETICEFMGVGRISLQTANRQHPTRKPCYLLYVRRIDDLRQILPELLPRCIIKHDALLALSEDLKTAKPAKNAGVIAAVGAVEIRRLYWEGGVSGGEIARQLGVTPGAVNEYMTRHGIPKRPDLERYQRSERGQLAILGCEEVRRLYWDERLSMRTIGRKVGVCPQAVFGYMRRHNIPTRNKREADIH